MSQREWRYRAQPESEWSEVTRGELEDLIAREEILPHHYVAWQSLPDPGVKASERNGEYHVLQDGNFLSYRDRSHLRESLDLHQLSPESLVYSESRTPIRLDELYALQGQFVPEVKEIIQAREGAITTVFSGPNSGGKSFLLNCLQHELGERAYLLRTGRIRDLHLVHYKPGPSRHHQQYSRELLSSDKNYDNNLVSADLLIGRMRTADRERLLSVSSEILGERIVLQRTDPKNDLSPYELSLSGRNFSLSSTGTRLLLHLLATCSTREFEEVLLDEPELGLSPTIQRALAALLFEQDRRKKAFPYLRRVWLATHSHIFLDRSRIENNWSVTRSNETFRVRQAHTLGDLHELQFKLLGNSLETVSLPDALVIVEGDSDAAFVSRACALRFPTRRVSVVPADGADRIPERLNFLERAFGKLNESPYGRLTIVLLDQKQKSSNRIQKYLHADNVIVWSKNGIEYVYPPSLLSRVFHADARRIETELDVIDHEVQVGDIRRTKKQLANEIADQLKHDTEHHPEFERFLTTLGAVLGG